MVFKASKFVITKNGVFVYIYEGLLQMNVNFVGNKNAFTSAYIIVSSDLWQARLECMNYSFIKTTMDVDLISKSKLKSKSREIFVQPRFSRKPFKSVERYSEILGLIHSDVCELNKLYN